MRTSVFGPRLNAAFASTALAVAAASVLAVLTGCTSTPRTPAPIVESSATSAAPVVQSGASTIVTPAPVVPVTAAAQAPVQPGFYRVKPGDTLYGVSRLFKQKPADIAKWNSLPESRQVNIGQVLRVAAPGSAVADSSAGSSGAFSASKSASLPPLLPTPGKSVAETSPKAQASQKTESTEKAEKPAASDEKEKAPTATASKGTFVWPVRGDVVRKFGVSGNKGIDIAGKVGEPVKAAASGKVVYAGSGLRSYGRMVIVRHSNDYLTAYAYNDKLLVKEGDTVKQGAIIADMGTAPGGSPSLHFEVRKSGAAVDPMPLLGAGG